MTRQFDAFLNSKTALGAAPATGDMVPVVDVSDTSEDAGGTLKRVSVADLLSGTSGTTGVVVAKVERTTNQTLSNATVTAILFTSEVWDDNGYHDNTTNPNRFTIPAGGDGRYRATVMAAFATNTSGRRFIAVRRNGTAIARTEGPPSTAETAMQCVAEYAMSAGDYFDFTAFQSSGGNLDLSATVGLWASLERVGG